MRKHTKYKPYETVNLTSRQWVNKTITKAPIWASSDLRDGNQALANPMSVEQKIRYFKALVKFGVKQIEVAYPSASAVEFEFCRRLIEDGLIPDDVAIGILTPSVEKHILKSFEALQGAKNIIMHLYNPTAQNQRQVVFKKSEKEIIDLAVNGTNIIKEASKSFGGNVIFEYSPESFSQTELWYARDVANAVIETYKPTANNKMILNLPNTLEACMPNIYADRIEWMSNNLVHRENIIISVHPHNDRGTAVASAEMAVLAGADRVEGTMLGNGERAGNVDLVTLAFNLYSQGIDPELNIYDIDEILSVVCAQSGLKIGKRHPYVGDMIYTAYSGTHQDAIKKGLDRQHALDSWETPYLPIDPKDIKREYKDLIKINAQSGKGGVAFVLKHFYNVEIDASAALDLSLKVKSAADERNGELTHDEVYEIYKDNLCKNI